MTSFTQLELAALRSLFSEIPDLAPELERQLSVATVTARKNTGAGFFTSISVPADVPPIDKSGPLDGETHAHIPGLEHGLGFVLFFDDGRLSTLEGFTYGSESTASLELTDLTFEIEKVPVNRAT
jgi:hypothetical protein